MDGSIDGGGVGGSGNSCKRMKRKRESLTNVHPAAVMQPGMVAQPVSLLTHTHTVVWTIERVWGRTSLKCIFPTADLTFEILYWAAIVDRPMCVVSAKLRINWSLVPPTRVHRLTDTPQPDSGFIARVNKHVENAKGTREKFEKNKMKLFIFSIFFKSWFISMHFVSFFVSTRLQIPFIRRAVYALQVDMLDSHHRAFYFNFPEQPPAQF